MISPDEFKTRMQWIINGASRRPDRLIDIETLHGDGDDLLIETLRSLGYEEGCDLFDKMPKWYA